VVKHSKSWNVIALIFIAIIFIGFRLVTQSGEPEVFIQNDGYAMSGGVLILAGGMGLGWWYANQKSFRKGK
jgi:predicted tellurium resistance membrane protein TerC